MKLEYRVQRTLDAFVVLNSEGAPVSRFFVNELVAERERKRLQDAHDRRLKRGPRPRLGCGERFWSEGIHNRLCSACKAHANGLGREMAG